MAIAIATAQRLLSLDPLNEVGHQALMHLYAGEARQDLALRQYETCRDRLRRELDVAPEPATEALHGEILARRSGTGSEAAASLYGSPAAAMVGSQIVRSDRPAIAVLPFVNQSGDPAQAYLSDGITEDIITELSRYRLLLIIARSSSFQFGGSAVNIAAVRRKLGVRYVVEGSMQDRNQRPGHGAAHRYKGIEAEQCFARAVALDANYVHALAWRSLSLTLNYFVDGSRNQAMIELAIASAQIALDLDDADSWSHQAMGCVCIKLGQMQLAGQHLDRAYQLNPNDVNIAGDRASWLLFAGRPEEAIRLLDAAMQRDPHPPTWIWKVRGGVLYHLKRYEEAIAACMKGARQPYWMPALLAAAYAQLGQSEDARMAIAAVLKLKPDCVLDTFCGGPPSNATAGRSETGSR